MSIHATPTKTSKTKSNKPGPKQGGNKSASPQKVGSGGNKISSGPQQANGGKESAQGLGAVIADSAPKAMILQKKNPLSQVIGGGKKKEAKQAQQAKKKGDKEEEKGKPPSLGSGELEKAKSPSTLLDTPVNQTKALPSTKSELKKGSASALKNKLGGVEKLSKNEQEKKSVDEKVDEAKKSVEPPVEEAQGEANTATVDQVKASPEPPTDSEKPKADLRDKMSKALPETQKDVENLRKNDQGSKFTAEANSMIKSQTSKVQGTYKAVENAPKASAKPPEGVIPDLEQAPETEGLKLGEGMVPPVPEEQVDFSEYEKSTDDMVKNELQDPKLEAEFEKAEAGPFAEARAERDGIKTNAKQFPKEAKAEQKKQQADVDKNLQDEETSDKKKMQEERKKGLTDAQNKQKEAKTGVEKKKLEISNKINGIYDKANKTIQKKLKDLEEQSLKNFEKGEKNAIDKFDRDVNGDLDDFFEERHSGVSGFFTSIGDWWSGTDDLPEVKAIFKKNRDAFIKSIDSLIDTITKKNQEVIKECKQILVDAKKEIDEFVSTLSKDEKELADGAVKKIQEDFDKLEKQIKDTEKKLKDKLQEKREEAIKKVDEKIEKMKEAMQGALAKLGNFLLDIAMKFFKWALKAAGYSPGDIMKIIEKGKKVITKIVTDPIGFIKNMIKAVKGGINGFKTNIKKHLIGGLVEWLTGSVGSVITIPAKFDLKGIMQMTMGALGLTWEGFREKLIRVGKVPEKLISAAETTVDVVKRVMKEGPIALWNIIKEKTKEIKKQVMDGIKTWLIKEVVKQGIIKLVSFLNPAGAIAQAILAIYNTIMFFVENWDRIVQMVKSIFNSIADIALGNLGGAMKYIEQIMAKTIPIILSFLARLLNLGGIGKAVKDVITKVKKPFDKILDKAAIKVGAIIMKMVKKVKGALDKGAQKLLNWWKKKKPFQTKAGEKHTLYTEKKGNKLELIVRSDPISIQTFINNKRKEENLTAKQKSGLDKIQAEYNTIKDIKYAAHKKEADAKDDSHKIAKGQDDIAKLIRDYDLMTGGATDFPDPNIKLTPDTIQHPDFDKIKKVDEESIKPEEKVAKKKKIAESKNLSTPVGSKSIGTNLSLKKGNKVGSEPSSSANAPLFGALHRTDRHWVKGHLMNHQLGGPGSSANMTPITTELNNKMKKLYENKIKKYVLEQARVVDYTVTVTHAEHTSIEPYYPQRYLSTNWNFTFALKKFEGGNWVTEKNVWGDSIKSDLPHVPHSNEEIDKKIAEADASKTVQAHRDFIQKRLDELSTRIDKLLEEAKGEYDKTKAAETSLRIEKDLEKEIGEFEDKKKEEEKAKAKMEKDFGDNPSATKIKQLESKQSHIDSIQKSIDDRKSKLKDRKADHTSKKSEYDKKKKAIKEDAVGKGETLRSFTKKLAAAPKTDNDANRKTLLALRKALDTALRGS